MDRRWHNRCVLGLQWRTGKWFVPTGNQMNAGVWSIPAEGCTVARKMVRVLIMSHD